jgi:hypothetical protein
MRDRNVRKWQRNTSWDQLGWAHLPDGSRVSSVRVGEPNDPNAPVVLRMEFPPGGTVGVHSHDTDYTEIIIAGSQRVTRKMHTVGDVRVVKAGTAYGPLVAGPEGATVLIIFRDGRWRGRAGRSSPEEDERREILAAFIDAPLATDPYPDV